ncbi:MAG: NAD(P)-dependent alcohol dehydrogenase [Ardenticatenaceae bacterium]|nr:NAD(P)-dependent alcohol dehydrogenase [Ardenticatenaceae bacterium]
MKAIVCPKYGSPDVLKFEDVQKPVPGDNEVLIKIHAAAANAGDWHLMRADPFLIRFMYGLQKPKYKILGTDVAGRVEAVGKNVTQFEVSDEVFGDMSASGFGAFAEYVCAPENRIALKPTNVTFEEAAAVPSAAVTALQALRDKGKIQAGQKVLINGASGGVGMFAVQIAKAFGAEVTAVCSTRNVEMARSIGADHVIDYTKEDFTQNGQQYDLILAANGYHPISDYRRALSPTGTYVMTGGSSAQMVQAMLFGPWISMTSSQTMSNMVVKPTQQDLVFMKALLETGKVAPVLDRRYPLSETAEAIRYLEEGHAKGKVIITIEAKSNGHGIPQKNS